MAYKFKFLIINEKPFNSGVTVARVNVSNLNKKGIESKWNELEKTFPKDKYVGCLQECNNELIEF